MNHRAAEEFARNEMLAENETLVQSAPEGPFVAAIVELAAGGYAVRVAQPAVVYGRKRSPLPDVVNVAFYGATGLQKARRRLVGLLDDLR